MRPEKAHRVVRKAIQNYLDSGGNATSLYAAKTALEKLDEKQRLWHMQHGYSYSELYSFVDQNYEDPIYEMEYISDRFNAPHRIAWLLKGVVTKRF